MASYREVEILRKESIATAGTKVDDLGIQKPITRLDFIWKKTNTNRTPIAHPGKIVSKIEIVDGADVLFSMGGQDAQAMAYYSSGIIPGGMINYELGQWSMQIASIYFGRYMWDEVLALDPMRHNNLQFRVEHNLALGGSTGTVANLSIYAHVFDEKIVQPKGFLRTKEQYSFLPVASAWEYIDLPMDAPIRALMFGANECQDGPEYNLAWYKLDEDNGNRLLLDSESERYMFQTAQRDPIWSEHLICKTAAAATDLSIYGSPHWERTLLAHVEGTAYPIAVVSSAGCLIKVQNATAAAIVEGFIQGHVPFGQVFVPMGNLQTEGDYWDVRNLKRARLSLQAGTAPDTDEYVRVYTQQVSPY